MKAEIIVRVWHVFTLIALGIFIGYLFSCTPKPRRCHNLQVIDCGHIVHNGDTVRFTTLPVKEHEGTYSLPECTD